MRLVGMNGKAISSVRSHGSAFEMKYQGKLIASGHFKEGLRLKTKSPERYYISCMSTECVPRHRSWGSGLSKYAIHGAFLKS